MVSTVRCPGGSASSKLEAPGIQAEITPSADAKGEAQGANHTNASTRALPFEVGAPRTP